MQIASRTALGLLHNVSFNTTLGEKLHACWPKFDACCIMMGRRSKDMMLVFV